MRYYLFCYCKKGIRTLVFLNGLYFHLIAPSEKTMHQKQNYYLSVMIDFAKNNCKFRTFGDKNMKFQRYRICSTLRSNFHQRCRFVEITHLFLYCYILKDDLSKHYGNYGK